MQLRNILRDVGEDLARGRLYLPTSAIARFGLTTADLDAIRSGARPVGREYRMLMESLMDVADADYRLAAEAIPKLPSEFRRAAAVASVVYQGIHGAIRRIGYDTLRRRAYTTLPRKVALATGALVMLARSCWSAAPSPPSPAPAALASVVDVACRGRVEPRVESPA